MPRPSPPRPSAHPGCSAGPAARSAPPQTRPLTAARRRWQAGGRLLPRWFGTANFVEVASPTGCLACAAGTFANQSSGATACFLCPPDTYSSQVRRRPCLAAGQPVLRVIYRGLIARRPPCVFHSFCLASCGVETDRPKDEHVAWRSLGAGLELGAAAQKQTRRRLPGGGARTCACAWQRALPLLTRKTLLFCLGVVAWRAVVFLCICPVSVQVGATNSSACQPCAGNTTAPAGSNSSDSCR